MKRFVSYLYSIYNNQKIHNAGFARIELRTGRNRIDIHLQENGYTGKSGTVYLFVRKQENIQGIPIGNIVFRNNQADFRYEQPEEKIGQTSWQIMQMNGIVVRIEDRIAFLSQWDEKPIDTNRFEVWEPEQIKIEKETSDRSHPGQDQGNAPDRSQADQGNMPDRLQADQDNVPDRLQADQDNGKVSDLQPDQKEDDTSSHLPSGQIKESINGYTDQGTGRENIADNGLQEQMRGESGTYEGQNGFNVAGMADQQPQPSTIHTAEIQPQPRSNRADWEQTWRYMLRMYPVLNQFDDADNVLCVRIEIKDVRLLPEKYWSMINNSFLLHGFFNYRYLVFGRIGQNWFIGIPGVYQNQEHVMASIFGFPDFLPQAQKNERGEQPGYWYRSLKI